MDFVHLTCSTPGQWNLPDVTFTGYLSMEGKVPNVKPEICTAVQYILSISLLILRIEKLDIFQVLWLLFICESQSILERLKLTLTLCVYSV